MPRPKVRPENRQRVSRACNNCKVSKRKCNAELPCSHCVRKGISDACQFSAPDAFVPNSVGDSNPNRNGVTTHNLLQNSNGRAWTTGADTEESYSMNEQRQRFENSTLGSNHSPEVSSTSTTRGQAVITTRRGMLSSKAGESIFIGGSASLSFLQLVRDTVSQCIGVSEFSEYPTRDKMLEADLDVEAEENITLESSFFSKHEECKHHYFLATMGVLDIVNKAETTAIFADCSERDVFPRAATGLLILAIGAQTMNASQDLLRFEKACFSRAQKLAFSSMLENPNLDMVRTFALLSFYMLAACRRNAAFMYLGVAARAAHALGLHYAESYKVLNSSDRLPRLRCWKSLVCLDIIVSSILGRASATIPPRNFESDGTETPLRNVDSKSVELEVVYKLSTVVNAILEEFYTLKIMTVEAAESHLHKLREWSDALPHELKLSGMPHGEPTMAKGPVLTSLQVSCYYYFAVMLVTRPFLISHLTSELRINRHSPVALRRPSGAGAAAGEAVSNADSETVVDTEDGPEIAELAAACLSAATFMAQTCADVRNLGFLLENMCLVKAWIFAAGLVLGFQIFAAQKPDEETQQAFSATQKVLRKFSERSPQAAHYMDILSRLNTAIEKQKHLLSRKRKRTTSFVTRIVDLQQGASRATDTNATPSHVHLGEMEQSMLNSDPMATFQLDPQLLQQDMDIENIFYGWDESSFGLGEFDFAGTRSSDPSSWNFLSY